MDSDARFEELVHHIMEYEKELHRQNQKRIRVGIRCLFWIPTFFLVLLFLTGSERAVFLVLFIVSLFAIAIYLIYVEYIDYQMQEKIAEISNREVKEANVLIGQDLDTMERNIIQALQAAEAKKEQRVEQAREMVARRFEEQKDLLHDILEKGKEDEDEEHTEDHNV